MNALADQLRALADDLTGLASNPFPPVLRLRAMARAASLAADEMQRQDETYRRQIRLDRTIEDEAGLLLDLLDKLGGSSVRMAEARMFLERAERRGTELQRAALLEILRTFENQTDGDCALSAESSERLLGLARSAVKGRPVTPVCPECEGDGLSMREAARHGEDFALPCPTCPSDGRIL